MGKTIQKPTLNEVVAVKTIQICGSDNDIILFNPQGVGPMNFAGLRQADYGLGFRMPPMSQLVTLLHASLGNQDCETAKKVISTLRNHWLIGNTGILYVPKGMFVQDNPVLKNGRISMNQKTLEKRLGSYQERGVVFSDDRAIRFTPYIFKIESQKASMLAENPAVIALTGSEKNAGRLARASDLYRVNPCLFALNKTNSPKTRVAGFQSSGEFDEGLNIYASLREDGDNRYSFGVWDGETEVYSF